MKIVDFLQKTIDGKLTLSEQKEYLINRPFPQYSELAEAAVYLRTQMAEVPTLPGAIDICGTGGSGLGRINTSTISAFLIAACGVPVAKHGNDAASGRFGSFDLLRALGVPLNLSNQELQLRFKECHLAFLYAKTFHPAMRYFAPVRAQINKPTFFNILGPLLSPVDAKRQIIGTSKIENARLIAQVAQSLGKDRVFVVSGSDGLDEVTLCGPTHVVELANSQIKEYDISPVDFGIKPANDFSTINSRSANENIETAENILACREKSHRTDLVLVNAALALFLAGKAVDLSAGYSQAKKALNSGLAHKVLVNYRRPSVLNRIAANDSKRNFDANKTTKIETKYVVAKYKGGLIAEIKQQSPSEGILRENINYADMARTYTRAGAQAISVLTENENFNGSFSKFSKARSGTSLPLLFKDFILRTDHIDKAKSLGADIILLITAMLDDSQLTKLYNHASGLGLQILIEVHTENELERALMLQPKMIGINSRSLHDFSINTNIFTQLSSKVPSGIIKVAESGIKKFGDIPQGYQGALVGSEIMKHPFPELKIKELSGRPILKLCGIRSIEQAALCEKHDVDMIGINLTSRSRRKVPVQTAKNIALQCNKTITVGVFEDQTAEQVNKIARQAGVDAIQLSGREKDFDNFELPIIKTIQPGQVKPAQAFLTILDAKIPGGGLLFDHSLIDTNENSLIAGGINLQIAKKLRISKHPLGFDTASGIETAGKVDTKKIKSFAKLFA